MHNSKIEMQNVRSNCKNERPLYAFALSFLTLLFTFIICPFAYALVDKDITITSPTKNKDLLEILNQVLNWLIIIAIPLITIMLIWTGIKFLTAKGNESEIAEAKRLLLYTIIGGAIVLGAYIIINTVVSIIDSKGIL